jgi:hypothetical protein
MFVKYENSSVKINNTGILASECSLSVAANLQTERLHDGSLLKENDGTVRYAATGPVKGELNLSYYLTTGFLSCFDVDQANETAVTGSLAGVELQGCYLKSTRFSVQPFTPIRMDVSFDVYGPIEAADPSNDTMIVDLSESGVMNGAGSFISGAGVDGEIDDVVGFEYSATINRTPVIKIGSSTPTRVTVDNVEKSISVNGEKFGSNLQLEGNTANLTITVKDFYSSNTIQNFNCSGEITNQGLSVGAGGYLQGNISVKQTT